MLHTSKDIRSPGLRTLPPGVERYFVRGGGLSIIEVLPEDKIEIINEFGVFEGEVMNLTHRKRAIFNDFDGASTHGCTCRLRK